MFDMLKQISMLNFQYPGPTEEGLKFQMERCARFPKFHILWIGFFRPIIILHHPVSMKEILKTSGLILQ
jgi:hypothetical protein